jgi:hypothetical protein
MMLGMFALTREKVTGIGGKLHKAFYNLYSLLNIILVVKSRRMRWMGCVTHMWGEERYRQGFGWEA